MHSLESVRVDKYLRNVGRDEEKVATPPKIILNLHHHKKTGKKTEQNRHQTIKTSTKGKHSKKI